MSLRLQLHKPILRDQKEKGVGEKVSYMGIMNGQPEPEIHHFSHQHPLQLSNYLPQQTLNLALCAGCKLGAFGSFTVSHFAATSSISQVHDCLSKLLTHLTKTISFLRSQNLYTQKDYSTVMHVGRKVIAFPTIVDCATSISILLVLPCH